MDGATLLRPPGQVCALLAAKDHVNLFLYDGEIVPDPEGIITAGHALTLDRSHALYDAADAAAP